MKTKLIPRPIVALAQLAVCSLLLFGLSPRAAAGGDPRILPANAKHAGKSLAEWQELSMVYSLTDAPINGSPYWNIADVKVGDVLLLQGTWDGIPKEVTVKAGTFLLLSINSMWGELYTDGSTDDPNGDANGYPYSSWGSMLTMSQTLDGSPVRVDLKDYGVPITWFDQPIYYAETSAWNSVAGIWFQSYGFMIKPLTPGVHTLTNHVEDTFFSSSWTDTYNITVVR